MPLPASAGSHTSITKLCGWQAGNICNLNAFMKICTKLLRTFVGRLLLTFFDFWTNGLDGREIIAVQNRTSIWPTNSYKNKHSGIHILKSPELAWFQKLPPEVPMNSRQLILNMTLAARLTIAKHWKQLEAPRKYIKHKLNWMLVTIGSPVPSITPPQNLTRRGIHW